MHFALLCVVVFFPHLLQMSIQVSLVHLGLYFLSQCLNQAKCETAAESLCDRRGSLWGTGRHESTLVEKTSINLLEKQPKLPIFEKRTEEQYNFLTGSWRNNQTNLCNLRANLWESGRYKLSLKNADQGKDFASSSLSLHLGIRSWWSLEETIQARFRTVWK